MIPLGYCQCGCGQKTKIATQNDATTGRVLGQPARFISGHNGRVPGVNYDPPFAGTRLCACGCGKRTKLATYTASTVGIIKGQPLRYIHGHARRVHGMCNTPEMKAFIAARNRCKPTNKDHRYYADAGVKFTFGNFEEFYRELGARPSPKHSVDRIDPNGHYAPGNVRWATPLEQQHNRRDNALRQALLASSPRELYRGKRWRQTVKRVLRRDHLCVKCHSCLSVDCDHRIPARVWMAEHNGVLASFFDLENLQGLCVPCHTAKTAMDYRFLVAINTDKSNRAPAAIGPSGRYIQKAPATIQAKPIIAKA